MGGFHKLKTGRMFLISKVYFKTVVIKVLFFLYLSRVIQFSKASLNRALTQHKNKDTKTLKTRQSIHIHSNHFNIPASWPRFSLRYSHCSRNLRIIYFAKAKAIFSFVALRYPSLVCSVLKLRGWQSRQFRS